MAKTRFEWNYEAAGDLLLRSPEIASVCESVAEKMTRATGVEYKADVYMGKTRVNAAARKKGVKKKGKGSPRAGKSENTGEKTEMAMMYLSEPTPGRNGGKND